MLPGQADTEFDAEWYLKQHPEVKDWIEQGEYAKPEIRGWEWDPNINAYRKLGRKGEPTGETNDLEGIIQEAPRAIQRRDIENALSEKQARESAMRGLGLEDMSPEAADQTSIFDTVGEQADYRRGLAQDYLSDLESLIGEELSGIRGVTNQYQQRLANAPATRISFGGQPVGDLIHRRPLQLAEAQYKAGLYPHLRTGELGRDRAAKEISLLSQFTPQSSELARFELLRDLVKQMEDRRYGLATTSQTTTADHGFDLMGTLANVSEGISLGNDIFDLFGNSSFSSNSGAGLGDITPFAMAGP
jgi:hypothetical protein